MRVHILEHSHRKYYLQWNTKSGRHRLIVVSPSHQIPKREKMTMKSDKERSEIYNERKDKICAVLNKISNTDFWKKLNELYNKEQQLQQELAQLLN